MVLPLGRAVEEGFVPGGGVMLLMAAKAITVKGDNEDLDAGIKIVRKALRSPPPQRSRRMQASKA